MRSKTHFKRFQTQLNLVHRSSLIWSINQPHAERVRALSYSEAR